MKTIGLVATAAFVLLTFGFLVLPAFFDQSPFGMLFKHEPAPWTLSEDDQKKFQYSEAQLKGRYHFQQYCAPCHGPEGRGNGPLSINLRKKPQSFLDPSSSFKNGLSAAGVQKTLNDGLTNSEMPRFEFLPEDVKQQLTDYIHFLNTNPSLF